MHTVRLTRGRGNEFATHATMMVYAANDPIGMRNIAKNRAPTFVDPVAMAFPIADISRRMKMWIERSLVFAAVQVTMTETKKVVNHTVNIVSVALSLRIRRNTYLAR